MACVLGLGLSLAGCGNSNNDKLIDATTKMMEENQKQTAKVMDAAAKQMEAGTELIKKENEAVGSDLKAGAVKANDAMTKAMDDAKKAMEKK